MTSKAAVQPSVGPAHLLPHLILREGRGLAQGPTQRRNLGPHREAACRGWHCCPWRRARCLVWCDLDLFTHPVTGESSRWRSKAVSTLGEERAGGLPLPQGGRGRLGQAREPSSPPLAPDAATSGEAGPEGEPGAGSQGEELERGGRGPAGNPAPGPAVSPPHGPPLRHQSSWCRFRGLGFRRSQVRFRLLSKEETSECNFYAANNNLR